MCNNKNFFPVILMMFMLTVPLIGTASASEIGDGTVNVEALRLRAEPNTSSTILCTVYLGEHVVVLEKSGEDWYKVSYKNVEGYMFGEYLDISATVETDLGYGRVHDVDSRLNIRADAGTKSRKVGFLDKDAVVKVTGIKDGWYHIVAGEVSGYVSGDYLVLCEAPEGEVTDSPEGPGKGNEAVANSSTEVGNEATEKIIAYAKEFLGVPYVYGASGPDSFDCSGFTQYVYAHFGYELNRSASGQLDNGREVPLSEIQPGDLVFFIYDGATTRASHVGIYIGNDEFIHASTGSKYSVVISQLLGGSYKREIVGVRRII